MELWICDTCRPGYRYTGQLSGTNIKHCQLCFAATLLYLCTTVSEHSHRQTTADPSQIPASDPTATPDDAIPGAST